MGMGTVNQHGSLVAQRCYRSDRRRRDLPAGGRSGSDGQLEEKLPSKYFLNIYFFFSSRIDLFDCTEDLMENKFTSI